MGNIENQNHLLIYFPTNEITVKFSQMWLVESLYNPQKVQYRFQTIRDEIGRKHVSRDLNKNADLLYVDKQAIYLGRNVRHGWEIMSGETRRIFDLIMDVNEHFKNRLLQLTDDLKEVRRQSEDEGRAVIVNQGKV